MTQRQAVIDYMKSHDGITQMEATAEIGCTRLAAQICYLRKHGMDIKTEMIQVPTRYGTATIARYSL